MLHGHSLWWCSPLTHTPALGRGLLAALEVKAPLIYTHSCCPTVCSPGLGYRGINAAPLCAAPCRRRASGVESS